MLLLLLMMMLFITKFDLMLVLFVINFNIVSLFDYLEFFCCCCCCLGHNVVFAAVLHFRFLLLLLLFATQPLQINDIKHLISISFYHCPRHNVVVTVVLHLRFQWFCSCCCLRQNHYHWTIPMIACPFFVTIITTIIVNIIFFWTYLLSMPTTPLDPLRY